MGHDLDSDARARLGQYIGKLGTLLKDRRKRESFAIYAAGVLGTAERKSVEPIASLASGDAASCRHMHDKLLHFVGGSQWSDAAIRLEAARHVCQALAQHERVTTWVVDMTVAELAKTIPHRKRRQLRWKEGTKGTLSGRFSFCRVKTLHEDGVPIAEREPTWLVIEWRSDEGQSAKFHLTTLPRRMSHEELVRIIKERWRTERMYEDLKGELGLDHFEGRSFRGWHHHVSVVICCYAFVVAERMRAFPPSTTGQGGSSALGVAA